MILCNKRIKNNNHITLLCRIGEMIMYLEIKDVKKSYGQNGSYVQVLKGVSTGVE